MPIIGVIASSKKGAPGIPTIGTATDVGTSRAYNNGAATVTFTAGAGATATSFTATSSPGGFTATGASSPLTVTGLQSSTSYTFTVTATNAAGTSAASTASNSITATTVPQSPTIGTATAGESSATVTYTAGATGGKAVSAYTATSSPGSLTGTGASPITVSGLTNGTAYTFTVTATNANGTSTASASSNSVTPALIGAIQAWSTGGTVPDINGGNVYQYFFAGAVAGSGGAGSSTYRFISVGGNATGIGQINSAYRYTSDNILTGVMPSTVYASPSNLTMGNGNRAAWATRYDGNAYLIDRATQTSFIQFSSYTGFTGRASTPVALNQANVVASSNGIYWYGGNNSGNTPLSVNYRWTSNAWTSLASMPAARSHVGMAAGGGYALCVGGGTTSGQSSDLANSNYVYNEGANSWSTGANHPQTKSNMMGAFVETGTTGVTANRYYLQGGFLTGFGQDNLCYSYTVSGNAWRAERNSPNGNAYSNFGFIYTNTNANNVVWTCGGENAAGNQRTIYHAQVI